VRSPHHFAAALSRRNRITSSLKFHAEVICDNDRAVMLP
jgi:hypothetical protein